MSTHAKEEEGADVLRRMCIQPVSTATLVSPGVASFAGLTQLLAAAMEATTSHRKLAASGVGRDELGNPEAPC